MSEKLRVITRLVTFGMVTSAVVKLGLVILLINSLGLIQNPFWAIPIYITIVVEGLTLIATALIALEDGEFEELALLCLDLIEIMRGKEIGERKRLYYILIGAFMEWIIVWAFTGFLVIKTLQTGKDLIKILGKEAKDSLTNWIKDITGGKI